MCLLSVVVQVALQVDPHVEVTKVPVEVTKFHVEVEMSRSRSPSPLNVATNGETISVTTSEVPSSTTTHAVRTDVLSRDELVSSSTTGTTSSIKNEEPNVPTSTSLSTDLSTSISSEDRERCQSKRTPPPPEILPLVSKSSDIPTTDCTSKDSLISSESFSSPLLQNVSFPLVQAETPVEGKSTKPNATIPSPLKEKMDRYELKMRHVRESIRLKRLQQGLTCHQCGRSYCRPYNLKRHIQYECGKAPQFPCMYCTYRARHKHDLKKHVTFKHASYLQHFQTVQDQLESGKLEQSTSERNLPDLKQKVRDQVNLRQTQNGGRLSDGIRNMSEQSGVFGGEFYKLLQQKSTKRCHRNENSLNSAAFRPNYNFNSEADLRANTDRSEVGLRIKTTESTNMEIPDYLAERERDSGVHSTETSPNARSERDGINDGSHSQCSSNGDTNYNAASNEDHFTGEDSNEELTIGEERPSSSNEGDRSSTGMGENFSSRFNPMNFNPYLSAFGAQQFNNNAVMNKILLENPILFQENLKNALIFMNQYNPALASGFPV